MARSLLLVGGLVLSLALPMGAAWAESDAEDPVLARVDGDTVRKSEVLELAESLGSQVNSQLATLAPMLVEQLVNVKLVGKAAQDAGLAQDEEVLRLMEARKVEIMREVYLERHLDEKITEEDLQARYQVFLEENPGKPEVHARHVLLGSEDEAREVIAALDGGADFVELAKERSTGPSGPDGGDLGFFTQDQMVPPFAAAAFALEPGSHTADPVETRFGWHVIKVEARREATQPEFAEIEEQLRSEMSRDVVSAMLAELRKAAEIEIIDNPSAFAPTAEGETNSE